MNPYHNKTLFEDLDFEMYITLNTSPCTLCKISSHYIFEENNYVYISYNKLNLLRLTQIRYDGKYNMTLNYEIIDIVDRNLHRTKHRGYNL